MGILNKLQTEGSNLSEFDGTTPPVTNEDTSESSITGGVSEGSHCKLLPRAI